MKKTYNEDVSIEDFFALCDFFDGATSLPVKKAKIISSAEEYLLRGEKLLSLAKEQFKGVCKNITLSSLEEKLFDSEIDTSYLQGIVESLSKRIRVILRKANSMDDPMIQVLLDYISSQYHVVIKEVPVECEPNSYHWKQVEKGDQVLCLTLAEDNYPSLTAYGLKNTTHAKSAKNVLYKSGDCVADIATILAWLVIFSICNRNISSGWNATSLQHERYTMYNAHLWKQLELWSLKEVEEALTSPWRHTWIVPEEYHGLFLLWKNLFDRTGVKIEEVSSSRRSLQKILLERAKAHVYNSPDEIPIIFEPETVSTLIQSYPQKIMENLGFIPYHSILPYVLNNNHAHYWAVGKTSGISGNVSELLLQSFRATYSEKHGQYVAISSLKSLASDYAKSFQTKKNIPAKTLQAMQESIFNEYFGYVEFDEDVDLNKVSIVADQFVAFKETYFQNIDATANALRFRRLGHHKASGLYYPNAKCLCVSINSPNSMIHEFGHLIDYCYGNLSLKQEFIHVRDEYEKNIRQSMQTDSTFASQMKGYTKYNLNYYLDPTEIWARCFELYAVKVLGVNNSLTPSLFGSPYPQNDTFIGMVKEYFTAVLPTLVSSSDDACSGVAASN